MTSPYQQLETARAKVVNHKSGCEGCQSGRRLSQCAEGRRLNHAEQAAWAAYMSSVKGDA